MIEAYSDPQLQAYLDESLPVEMMSSIEQVLRENPQMRDRLVSLVGQREAGVHGIGEIWRRHRLSCPTRQQLGAFLLGAIDEHQERYIAFHLKSVGCRVCNANALDLQSQHSEQTSDSKSETQSRRRRYFQTSAGFLKPDREK